MPEVVSIYDFIWFLFYLLSLIWKSPFFFLGQYLLTRLICLDFGP
uniref:Rps12 n=1 Tax=Arundo donax TaxID=35708 RepID=A0A0A8XV75_ARUDO